MGHGPEVTVCGTPLASAEADVCVRREAASGLRAQEYGLTPVPATKQKQEQKPEQLGAPPPQQHR